MNTLAWISRNIKNFDTTQVIIKSCFLLKNTDQIKISFKLWQQNYLAGVGQKQVFNALFFRKEK